MSDSRRAWVKSNLRIFGISLAFSALLFCTYCNPREPGCLDIDAENFDFAAEKHDQESCVYPDLLLNVLYKWGDDSFSPGDVYTNDLGQVFTIENFHMLFSQFVLTDELGERSTIDNRVDWYLKGGSEEFLEIPDDFVLVDRSLFDFRLGQIRTSTVQEGLQFALGVPDTLTPVYTDSLPDSHVLLTDRVLYDPILEDFNTARFVLNRDTSMAVLDTMVLHSGPKQYDFVMAKDFVQGRDDTVRIAIDLRTVFQTVDLNRSISEIVEDLAEVVESAVSNNN